MKRAAAWIFLLLILATGASADLANPSTLLVRETSPSRFTVELTLPVINGRVLKAHPVLPEVCAADPGAETRGDATKMVRTWTMTCDSSRFTGAPFGVDGLLGTPLQVLLTVDTLDGRRHVEQLRATRAFFFIPPPPTLVELTLAAGRHGAGRLLRRPELALLLLAWMLTPARRRTLMAAFVAFVAAQALGQCLPPLIPRGAQWMTMPAYLPGAASAGAAWLAAFALVIRAQTAPARLWVPMLGLGLLYGLAWPETLPATALSEAEQRLACGIFAAGALGGFVLMTACAQQLRAALASLPEVSRQRWTSRLVRLACVGAGGAFFYWLSAPLWGTAKPSAAGTTALGLVLAALFSAGYRLIMPDDSARPVKAIAILALVAAGLWRLAENREWFAGPVAADLAMGVVRLPLLAAILVLAAFLVWPRQRRFRPRTGTSPTHWVLLALAFFLLPFGNLRVDIPFHVPEAPSAAEAGRVMDMLLTETYLAFNLDNEDAAFDRLDQNLSQDLVADVYLDSRRRLTAGTRQGAEVTVRDVSVVEVDAATAVMDGAFTYPCQWVVTARVRHLQHVHNRRNVYGGELTLRIEGDRWKIAGLNLLSEERVVLAWTSS